MQSQLQWLNFEEKKHDAKQPKLPLCRNWPNATARHKKPWFLLLPKLAHAHHFFLLVIFYLFFFRIFFYPPWFFLLPRLADAHKGEMRLHAALSKFWIPYYFPSFSIWFSIIFHSFRFHMIFYHFPSSSDLLFDQAPSSSSVSSLSSSSSVFSAVLACKTYFFAMQSCNA